MAQNVGRPRFYINILEYLGAIGYTEIDDVYRLNPTLLKDSAERTVTLPEGIFTDKAYVAYLGHSAGALNLNFAYTSDVSVNAQIDGTDANSLDPEHTGFSIASFNGDIVEDTITTYTGGNIGSIAVGTYYDMPHSPDLNLKLSYEYDGVKTIQTKGGATLSNATYTKPADWGEIGAWQLGNENTPNPSNLRSGRRVWDLSFSYLSDTDVMPNLGVQNYEEGAVTEDILTGTDFSSQTWNRTLGGHLPFIFQPDKDNDSPDQFAIARFDMKSLRITQTMRRKYNVKLKIREIW